MEGVLDPEAAAPLRQELEDIYRNGRGGIHSATYAKGLDQRVNIRFR